MSSTAWPAASSGRTARWAWAPLRASFFVSGACALTYQVCWQRALFGAVGVDIDSVTLIVSCFMLGIGLGGMAGGVLADRHPRRRVQLYAACELLLALFGVCSLWLVRVVSDLVAVDGGGGRGVTAVAVFALLAIPTTLMGATLPILTMAFDRLIQNVGLSVGTLYFWNTLGAAVAAWLCPFVLFDHIGLAQCVQLAAAGNVAVALTALAVARPERQQT